MRSRPFRFRVLCLGSAFLLGGAAAVSGAGDLQVAEATTAEVTICIRAGNEALAQTWLRVSLRCSELITSVIGPFPEHPVSRVVLTLTENTGSNTGSASPLRPVLPSDADAADICHHLINALILSHFPANSSARRLPVNTASWVSAGLTHRLLFSRRTISGTLEPDFEAIRYLMQEGTVPDIEMLVSRPILPDEGLFYHVYALNCDLLISVLTSLGNRKGNPVCRMLEFENYGRESLASLNYVLQPFLPPGQTVGQWYVQMAEKISRKGRRLNRAARTAERIQDLETVPAVAPSQGQVGCTRIPIEDVPERLRAYKVDSGAVREIEHELFEITKDAPYALHESLAEYMKAFQLLEKGKIRGFRKSLGKARRQFQDAVARQERLEDYLDELEQAPGISPEPYSLYTSIVRRYSESQRRLDPRMAAYLDQFEP